MRGVGRCGWRRGFCPERRRFPGRSVLPDAKLNDCRPVARELPDQAVEIRRGFDSDDLIDRGQVRRFPFWQVVERAVMSVCAKTVDHHVPGDREDSDILTEPCRRFGFWRAISSLTKVWLVASSAASRDCSLR